MKLSQELKKIQGKLVLGSDGVVFHILSKKSLEWIFSTSEFKAFSVFFLLPKDFTSNPDLFIKLIQNFYIVYSTNFKEVWG